MKFVYNEGGESIVHQTNTANFLNVLGYSTANWSMRKQAGGGCKPLKHVILQGGMQVGLAELIVLPAKHREKEHDES